MTFIDAMMLKNGISLEEARKEWKRALADLRKALEKGWDPEETLLEMFGLEADFLEDFLPYL